MAAFRFKQFSLNHDSSTMKIGTDALLLSASTDVLGSSSILDIGCGCGVIAFCLAQKLSQKTANPFICGVDIDVASIAEARKNAQHFALVPEKNFCFMEQSVQQFSLEPAQTHRYDLIVSNPPFYDGDLKPLQSKKLQSKHNDGQLPFTELLDSVLRLLAPHGRLAIILPKREGEEFDALAATKMQCIKRILVQPTPQKPVHRLIQEYSLDIHQEYQEQWLTLRDENHNNTTEYTALVEPFLL